MDAVVSGVRVEPIGIDQGSGTVRSQCDREQTSASMAVITTLADVMEHEPSAEHYGRDAGR